MSKDAYTECDPKVDIITLVAGDVDYVPGVEELIMDGYTVEVAFWGHVSDELKKTASRFINLDKFLNDIMYNTTLDSIT